LTPINMETGPARYEALLTHRTHGSASPKPVWEVLSTFHEETHDPLYADRRNFYKVEKWSRDGLRVELMLYAGNNLDKARRIFERTHKLPAAHPADDPPAHAGVGRVATAAKVDSSLGGLTNPSLSMSG
jgi:hypothetical protein